MPLSSYVSAALRRLVAARIEVLCEYCLGHEDAAVFGCEAGHIVSEKHGGATAAENLAYACAFCNRAQGRDLGSIVHGTGSYVRFFNPRVDRWAAHFTLDGVTIVALSDCEEVTARILDFNNSERFLLKQILMCFGWYSSAVTALLNEPVSARPSFRHLAGTAKRNCRLVRQNACATTWRELAIPYRERPVKLKRLHPKIKT